MAYQQLPDLATLHVAELRRAATARQRPAAQHRAVAQQRAAVAAARRPPSLRARAGWTLVTLGLSLAVRPPVRGRLRAG